jgi:hypothetical protein
MNSQENSYTQSGDGSRHVRKSGAIGRCCVTLGRVRAERTIQFHFLFNVECLEAVDHHGGL